MPSPVAKSQFVKSLKEKDSIQSPFLVKFSAVQQGKTGKPYMNLVLMDQTGEIEARVWDDVHQYAGQVVRDAFVLVEGKVQSYQGRLQVVVSSMQILREDEVEMEQYLPKSHLNADVLHRELLGFVESMKDPYYRALAEAVLRDDADIVSRMKRAPAAKTMHHAYPVGLLEHVLSITRILDFIGGHYGSALDRDLLFLGGFFHDIAKVWELSYDRVTDYTTEGKLVGHIVMGVELVDRKIRELEAQPGRLPGLFPEEKKLLVKHLILAHHGKLEYGSPVLPQCLEALIVHYVDDLDSKVNAIGKFIEADQTPGQWTSLHRHYERFFFKGVGQN